MNIHYPFVAERAQHRCEYCLAPEAIFNFAFEVEHIQPLALGGTDARENLALSCRSCNLFKGDRISGSDEQTGESILYFSPRTDRWAAHFRYLPEEGAIVGLTATGRVTVEGLRMNRPMQRAARRIWVKLGIFP